LSIGAKSSAARFKTQKVRRHCLQQNHRGERLKETFRQATLYDLWVHLYKQRKRRRLGATN
jgi:hypothetical protein